jgi:hypothetical protein
MAWKLAGVHFEFFISSLFMSRSLAGHLQAKQQQQPANDPNLNVAPR